MDRRKLLLVVAVIIAALGTGLVYLYVQGAEDRATEQFDGVTVLTASAVIPAGESIEQAMKSGKVVAAKISANQKLEGAMTEIGAIAGQSANTAIYPGEQIIPAKFSEGVVAAASVLPIPEGMVASSVQLSDPARVAGFVNPGSRISVFMNGNGEGGQAFTRLLLDDVTVLGVGSTTPVAASTTDATGATTTEQLPRTLVTLALAQKQAERVSFAAANGELWVALRNDKSAIGNDEPVTSANLWKK